MNLTLKETLLESAVARLTDAASTRDIGRSYPAIEMLTDANDTVHTYLHAVRIVSEALADAAEHAATSAREITLGFTELDEGLAQGAS